MAIAPVDVREVAGWMRLEKAPRRWGLPLDGSYRDLITKSQQLRNKIRSVLTPGLCVV